MGIGDVTPAEGRVLEDPETRVRLHQLTDHHAHSHHLYFTNSGLWDGGRRLLIGSHRNNARNFYSVELAGGEITQLTDFRPDARPRLLTAFVNPVRDEAYFIHGRELRALDLRTCRQRTLHHTDEVRGSRMGSGMLSCTADGRTVCLVLQEDLSGRIRMDVGHGYVGFAEYSAARPLCQIVAVPVDGGEPRLVYEEKFWLNHVNTSPALPEVLTFCHEGPWEKIEQRMWLLNIATGQAEPLRPQVPGETIGHEYWFADGQRVGYHGSKGGVHRFGHIRWDNTDCREYDFPYGSTHFHSLDETLIVGDGSRDSPHLLLWRLRNGRYEGPRRLLTHRGSWHVQLLHVHPRMFAGADGRARITFTADPQGYGNVYIADVPDFESLPEGR
ncbi:MAG TPA: oligogalacturonate lyase family protein [Phycisphaerae bacterium]|nr:oligogalacturonate lyase family protein [Phycisphaerae bacterium]